MEKATPASPSFSPSPWHWISSAVADAIAEFIFDWDFPMLHGGHRVSRLDHTRIVGINPAGEEVTLQGFHYPQMIPGLVESCVRVHRWENPDLLIGVLDAGTGAMDWS